MPPYCRSKLPTPSLFEKRINPQGLLVWGKHSQVTFISVAEWFSEFKEKSLFPE
jgi:hypothetical protein